MTDHAASDRRDSGTERLAESSGAETVERYETDEGVVFFDAENPLAWVEATKTLRLREQV